VAPAPTPWKQTIMLHLWNKRRTKLLIMIIYSI